MCVFVCACGVYLGERTCGGRNRACDPLGLESQCGEPPDVVMATQEEQEALVDTEPTSQALC